MQRTAPLTLELIQCVAFFDTGCCNNDASMSMNLNTTFLFYLVSLESIKPVGLFNQHSTHPFDPWSDNLI